MAKLGKQKFYLTGDHKAERTTFPGQVELYLHYNAEKDYFHFEKKEMEEYLPKDIVPDGDAFSHCKTKQQALDVIEILISKALNVKRKLRIEIATPRDLHNVKNPVPKKDEWDLGYEEYITNDKLPEYLRNMLHRSSVYEGRGLHISFERIVEVELNGEKMYARCDENWAWKRSDLSGYGFNLIDWTPEAENFLIEAQEKLDSLCKMVLEFFNAGNEAQALLERMKSNTKLLPG